MKLAVLADVHANFPALSAVAADLARWQPDRVVVAGDMINRGPRPAECLAFLLQRRREAGWQLVLGNHEEYVLTHAPTGGAAAPAPRLGTSLWTYQRLNGQCAALRELPFLQSWIMPDGSEARVVHASMRSTRRGISPETPDDELRDLIAPPPKLLVVGHTHIPLLRSIDKTLVVNAGAAGLPFDGNPRACYARLTWYNHGWSAEIVRVPYDRAQADRDFDETGFNEQIGPLARLIRAELAHARSLLGEWAREYESAVRTGHLPLAESVDQCLARYG